MKTAERHDRNTFTYPPSMCFFAAWLEAHSGISHSYVTTTAATSNMTSLSTNTGSNSSSNKNRWFRNFLEVFIYRLDCSWSIRTVVESITYISIFIKYDVFKRYFASSRDTRSIIKIQLAIIADNYGSTVTHVGGVILLLPMHIHSEYNVPQWSLIKTYKMFGNKYASFYRNTNSRLADLISDLEPIPELYSNIQLCSMIDILIQDNYLLSYRI